MMNKSYLRVNKQISCRGQGSDKDKYNENINRWFELNKQRARKTTEKFGKIIKLGQSGKV